MAQWTNYWKIITPASRKEAYKQPSLNMDDSYDLQTAGYAAFSTTSWYSNLLRGAQARLQRYKQYDAMDHGDISRALDIIAEEISNVDRRTDLQFQIDYQTEENQNISDNTVTTLRAALRHWCNFHSIEKRCFNIARSMVKYGDCFFRKSSDTKKWEHIDATRVIGIEINPDTQEKISYHIRPASFKQGTSKIGTADNIEIVPAAAMIHFTLSDDMGPDAPFGMSCLQPAFRDYQKLSMLEDSAVIYRIVRAPERRVFYIDVGNQPPQRVKQYLDSIKNDIRQKRVPNTTNTNQTDSTYNPESIQEDYFFPVTAGGRGSRVETLPGGATWETPELDYFKDKVLRALRVPTSYMKGPDAAGAQYSDGKVGIAYIEELRFANFIIRLQTCLEEIFDAQFKTYLHVTGINVDSELFKLKLPDPQNFALYRQSALDAELITAFKSIEDTKYLSKRFMLKRYLGLSEDDIQMNETLLKQERNIEDENAIHEIQQIYDPAVFENRESISVSDEAPAPEQSGDAGDNKQEQSAQ